MNPQQNVNLADYSTMGLGGSAAYLLEIHERGDIQPAVQWARERQLPLLMIGGGSNIIWRDEGFPGLLLVNKITGFETQDEDETNVYLTIGAGENWDGVVERSVQAGLTGIEALSLIPGTAGATPVQNVGAYGQDISQTLTTIEAYDMQAGQLVTIPASDCAFGYRTSRFKTADRHRFLISSVTLHLTRGNPRPPFYRAVQNYFDEHDVKTYSPAVLREAVLAIRTAKLPDPAVVRNAGSFFANPIVDKDVVAQLRDRYPAMPAWETSDPHQRKIPAAWLLDTAGLKGVRDSQTGMATWPTQPLVLVNEHAASTADLLAFKQKIVTLIQKKFDITLRQEPELLP